MQRAPLEDILMGRIHLESLQLDINSDISRFNQAIEFVIHGKQPLAWRAACILNHCTTKFDQRLAPYIDKIIDSLDEEAKDGYNRELIKLLLQVALDDEQEGLLFDFCFRIWQRVQKSPSVRIIAFRFMIKTIKKYPELYHEIEHVISKEYTETLSSGIMNSFYKLLAQVNK